MFKPIPGFSRYHVNEAGDLRNIETGIEIPWHKSNAYLFAKILDDYGNPVSLGKHRELCLALKELPDVSEEVTVNHKDGDKGNNSLDNLEWTTYSQNQLHAYMTGLRKDTIPSIARNIQTGETKNFFSKGEVARVFGLARSELRGRFKTVGDWVIEFLIEKYQRQKTNKYPLGLLVRNIFTGQIVVCSNETDAGKITGVHPKVINRVVRDQRFEFPVNGYDIRAFDERVKWPEYSKEEIEAFEGQYFIHQPVWVSKTGSAELLFPSVKSASVSTGTHERQIRERVKDGKRCENGFSYRRHKRTVETIQ